MNKKIKCLIMILALMFIFTLVSCDNQTTTSEKVTLPDLTDMTRAEIKETLDRLNINYVFRFSDVPCYDESYYDKFVEYGKGYQPGKQVDKDEYIDVKTTPLRLDFDYLDQLKLTKDYEGKSFIDDGIGEVKLVYSIDGDTAKFIDPNSKTMSDSFNVRFLGIDTPESTFRDDPWGHQASKYTKDKLQNAKTIVLEAEGARTETYGRYLAFVWVDGVLLNLELVQEAYCTSTLSSSSAYFSVMIEASMKARATGRRFYGERDLYYDYDNHKSTFSK